MSPFKNIIKVLALIVLAPIVFTGCISHITTPLTFFPFLMSIRAINFNLGIVSEAVLQRWELLTWITYIQLVCMLLVPGLSAVASFLSRWTDPRLQFQKYLPLKPANWLALLGLVVLHVAVIGGLTVLYFPTLRGADPYPGVRLQRIPAVLAFIWGLFLWGVLAFSGAQRNVPRSAARRPTTIQGPPRLRLKQGRNRGYRPPAKRPNNTGEKQ